MKTIQSIIGKAAIAALVAGVAAPALQAAEVNGWGDFKLFIDPGHSMKENKGMWGYTEAQKTVRVALALEDYLKTYTDITDDCVKLTRYDDVTNVSLEERSDMANAWGADFYYSIHSDAAATNQTLTLFGGWMDNGVAVEKTPNGGKAFGEILCPNLTAVMQITTQGNWYDRYYYDRTDNHTNKYPYLSVNRRTTCASLLSEGGCHTIGEQQQRNLNDDYKRLEALAAFQSILKHRGLDIPATTALTGIIRNSETLQPINGATVTVDGRTYTTNTWEDTFSAYTNNPDLIHNGFYLFEGLTAGQTYDVTFTADGFETYTTQATINAGGELTSDYVTYLDVNLTNIAPAKVASVSISDYSAVNPLNPITLTFSRAMDRTSVENALSINRGATVLLSWQNDFTLDIDVSSLEPLWSYIITIDGSVARNSQTNQLFDGDGDGVEGGDYTLKFTMAEPDTEAPQVIATWPEAEGAVQYTYRPVIGIEFNEELNFNTDKNADCITLTDKDGNTYEGTLEHEVVRGQSVLQFYPSKDLPMDRAILVQLDAGLEDLSGNVTEEPFYFRFLTEYRGQGNETVLQDFSSIGNWWAPSGSGSTAGIDEDESTTTLASRGYTPGSTSMHVHYLFMEDATNPNWMIREYWSKGSSSKFIPTGNVLTSWVYGDASNNGVTMMVRDVASNGLLYKPHVATTWRGWRLLYWDFDNDEQTNFTGTSSLGNNAYIDSYYIRHEDIDPDEAEEDDDLLYQYWEGDLYFDMLAYSAWDSENFERTANINDVVIETSGITEVNAGAAALTGRVFNLQGIELPRDARLTPGLYIIDGQKVYVK
ncbi:MAG: Ig-like domain-containing protein [Bacteroidales bacterium]|nr:Ig-like domain-containing protein [Bacteroidales bacterium]